MKRILGILCGIILCFTGLCGCNRGTEIIEQDAGNIVELSNWFFTSGVPNNVIRIVYSNEDTSFHCYVNDGVFWIESDQQYAKDAVIRTNESLYWHPMDMNSDHRQIYVDIVMRENDHYTGYVIIEIEPDGTSGDYRAEVIKSTEYPQINGTFQSITEEQVKKRMEDFKS